MPPTSVTISKRPTPIFAGVSMIIMTTSILMLGFFAPIIIDAVNVIAHEIINEYVNYINAVSKIATLLTPETISLP